jgi:hypothetical protein
VANTHYLAGESVRLAVVGKRQRDCFLLKGSRRALLGRRHLKKLTSVGKAVELAFEYKVKNILF